MVDVEAIKNEVLQTLFPEGEPCIATPDEIMGSHMIANTVAYMLRRYDEELEKRLESISTS